MSETLAYISLSFPPLFLYFSIIYSGFSQKLFGEIIEELQWNYKEIMVEL
jgi:hypothetical protein